MTSILLNVPQFYREYKSWISKNPQTASELETTIKYLSYFIAGRINNSHLVSELVYSLSNLLVLFNDRIINGVRQINVPKTEDKLKIWLTILEYSEVFLELSAKKLWGNKGKWMLILAVHLFKCVSRFMLIFRYKEQISETPAVSVIDRRLLQKSDDENLTRPVSFQLKNSGRIIRKVDSAPPANFRSWKPIQEEIKEACENRQNVDNSPTKMQLIAESLYIIKPLIHLGSIKLYNENTWKPYGISLLCDLLSLYLYKKSKEDSKILSYKQRLQISRRTVGLLLYLLRSPFYEKYSKERINDLLRIIGNTVPFASLICTPLAHYLPFWQNTYFYVWTA